MTKLERAVACGRMQGRSTAASLPVKSRHKASCFPDLNRRACSLAVATEERVPVLHRLDQLWKHDKLTILNAALIIAILAFIYFVVLS